MQISKTNLKFLKTLQKNNNREWFNQNKDWYLKEHQNTIDFADALIEEMEKYDQIETPSGKRSLFRIYRDVRFSKDKTPYTSWFSGYLRRSTPMLRGGYYFRIMPKESRIGCGFARPNSDHCFA